MNEHKVSIMEAYLPRWIVKRAGTMAIVVPLGLALLLSLSIANFRSNNRQAEKLDRAIMALDSLTTIATHDSTAFYSAQLFQLWRDVIDEQRRINAIRDSVRRDSLSRVR